MSNIEFEDKYTNTNYSNNSDRKGMIGWLVNKGLVKDRKSAEITLLVIAVIFFAASIFLFVRNSSTSGPQPIENAPSWGSENI